MRMESRKLPFLLLSPKTRPAGPTLSCGESAPHEIPSGIVGLTPASISEAIHLNVLICALHLYECNRINHRKQDFQKIS